MLSARTLAARDAIIAYGGDISGFNDKIDLRAHANLPATFERATAIAKEIPYSQVDSTDFIVQLTKLSRFLRYVYDAQSTGFDIIPADQDEIELIEIIKPSKKTLRSSQGFALSAAEKRAVELRAMHLAEKWFASRGYETTDTSSSEP